MHTKRLAFVFAPLVATISPAAAELPPSIQTSAACAPVGTVADSSALRVTAARSQDKTLYNAGERIMLAGGSIQGLLAGQRFFVRRPMTFRDAPRAEHTIGWLRIVDVRDSTAFAEIEFTCDAVAVGDHLEAFNELALPPHIDRTDATGAPDFAQRVAVSFGNDGRETEGDRDYVLVAGGRDRGITPGARYALYRGRHTRDTGELAFAEAIAISVFPNQALLRITDARDVVRMGDTAVLRVGGTGTPDEGGESGPLAPHKEAPPDQPEAQPAISTGDIETQGGQVTFEDVHFQFDLYTLRPEARALLDDVLKTLQDDPSLRLRIEGYTCNIGKAAYNLALGARRANAVRDYLVERGIPAERLRTVSYGETHAKFDNTRRDTRSLNRRAALVVNVERATDREPTGGPDRNHTTTVTTQK